MVDRVTVGRVAIVAVGLVVCAAGLIRSKPQAVMYVSNQGNDAWSGSLPEPNPERTDGPFATVVRARDEIRKLKGNGAGNQPITVFLRGGVYFLAQPFVLGPNDSGSARGFITYASYPSENAVITGGRRITGWVRVRGDGRIPRVASGQVWMALVRKHWRFNQLFADGVRLPRSATPNGAHWESWYKATGGTGLNTIHFAPGSVAEPSDPADAEVNFLPEVRYTNALLPLKDFDGRAGRLVMTGAGAYRIGANDPFRIENAIEGIDLPGEWCIDSTAGRVYLWPPGSRDPNHMTIAAPVIWLAVLFRGNEAAAQFVHHIALVGITIRYVDRARWGDLPEPFFGHWQFGTNDSAILMVGVEDCRIDHCRITNVGGDAIRAVLYAKRLRLENNEIWHCGGAGISFQGYWPGRHNVNQGHIVSGNHIHHIGEISLHSAAVESTLAGNLSIVANHLHDTPESAVQGIGMAAMYFHRVKAKRQAFRWDEIADDPLTVDSVKQFVPGAITVANNLVHDTNQVMDDGGAIYFWASHNDIITGNRVYRSTRPFSYGIYLDTEESDTLVANNIVYDCPLSPPGSKGASLIVNPSSRNVVRNNIFALSSRLFIFNDASLFGRMYLAQGGTGGNRISHNIFVYGTTCLIGLGPSVSGRTVDGNNIFDNNLYWSTAGASALASCVPRWRSLGWDTHSVIADPRFVDSERFNFTLLPGSPAFSIGFNAASQ
jgi:parallel beta-helix repeat protein